MLAKKVNSITDKLRNYLIIITAFFKRIKWPETQQIKEIKDSDSVSSSLYNKYVNYILKDIYLIDAAQNEIRNNILAGWNNLELMDIPESDSILDNNFVTEYPKVVYNGIIIPHIAKAIDLSPSINGKPIISASASDGSEVYYGKAYGRWIKNDEQSEDGIRPAADPESLIDNKDTFWECEVVKLYKTKEHIVNTQKLDMVDIVLKATIKIVFKDGVDMNYIEIDPNTFASDAYYNIESIVVSNGYKQEPIDISDNDVIGKYGISFISPFIGYPDGQNKIRSFYIVIRQENSYPLKYDVGYFKLGYNKAWVDITGPEVLRRAKEIKGDINKNISYVIEHINEWISALWLPGITTRETAKLDESMGNKGYMTVQSFESNRKRYAISIKNIGIYNNEYSEVSEGVTNKISLPENARAVKLYTDDYGDVSYFISFDDGILWRPINPYNKVNVYSQNKIVPKYFMINSDISPERKEASIYGSDSFVNTKSDSLRVRMVLTKNEVIPYVRNLEVEIE